MFTYLIDVESESYAMQLRYDKFSIKSTQAMPFNQSINHIIFPQNNSSHNVNY